MDIVISARLLAQFKRETGNIMAMQNLVTIAIIVAKSNAD